MSANTVGSNQELAQQIGTSAAKPVSVQAVATGGTIVVPASGIARLSAAAAATAMILGAGKQDGQQIVLMNVGATNDITFASNATSRVANGTSAVVTHLKTLLLTWDTLTSLWYNA